MLISTRGRYALRVMIDLVEQDADAYIPLKEIAQRQGLSLKYIEQIMPTLTKNGLVEGIHGKGGGYRLCHKPEEYKVGEIFRLTEGDLAPVTCLECGAQPCERIGDCRTISMWSRFYDMINEFFDGITVADLMKNPSGHSSKENLCAQAAEQTIKT